MSRNERRAEGGGTELNRPSVQQHSASVSNPSHVSPSPSLSPPSGGPSGPVLLFDGVCNLCNRSVQFILRHECAPTLRFAALQSPAGRGLLVSHGLPADHRQSLVLIVDGRALTESDAAAAVAAHLRAPWRWARALRLLPRGWRDAFYRFIASRRYRWFGRRPEVEACLLPRDELRSRFLVS